MATPYIKILTQLSSLRPHLSRRLRSVVVGDVVLYHGRGGLARRALVLHRVRRLLVRRRRQHRGRDLRPSAAGDCDVLVRRSEVSVALGLHVLRVAQVAPHLPRPALLALAVSVAAEAAADHQQHHRGHGWYDDGVGDAVSLRGRLACVRLLQHKTGKTTRTKKKKKTFEIQAVVFSKQV